MGKLNKEAEEAIKERFGELLSTPKHDERVMEKDYTEHMKSFEMELSDANPDNLFSTDTPWMNVGYLKKKEKLEKLNEAIEAVLLNQQSRLVLDLFLGGYTQAAIATVVGLSQPEVSKKLRRIGKKIKKVMDTLA